MNDIGTKAIAPFNLKININGTANIRLMITIIILALAIALTSLKAFRIEKGILSKINTGKEKRPI